MALTSDSSANKNNDHTSFIAGDSQMASLMRSYDWESHPLGAPDKWPLSLKTGLRILLHSAHPMFIWWSEELYIFYNDGYMPLIGNKHPEALGAKGHMVWAEIWPQLGAVIEGIMKGEKAFFGQELLVPINRKGFTEETFFTFSYSAMYDDEGNVNGIFCACHEATETVLAKRRLKILTNLTHSLTGLAALEQASRKACEVLADNPQDVPFSLIYLLNHNETEASLVSKTAGLPLEKTPFPETLCLNDLPANGPFARVREHGQAEKITISAPEISPENPESPSPYQAVILPVFQSGPAGKEDKRLLGFFISGISPRLEYDSDYENFLQLISGQLAGFFSDIQSRAEIINQKGRLERFFMQAPAAICILDGPDLVFELVNPGYQQLFPERELLGKPILEALPEIAENKAYRTIKEVYETGKTLEEHELLIPFARAKDGLLENRYFKYIQQARHDSIGNIDGVLIFGYEVTELVNSRRQAEASEKVVKATSDELTAINEELSAANEEILASNDELAHTNDQLLRINADLDNFIYSASHDLKAPIINIEGLLEVLLKSLPPELQSAERIQKITGMMKNSVDRFRKTINSLTEITRLQKENNQHPVLNNISEVINDVILDLEPMVNSTKARLEIDTTDCSSIQFSQKNLRSIIYNLLSNALKYHSPERTPLVQVSCRKTDEYIILSVKDNGLGMNLTDDSKIFAMFKRLHSHVEGDGIGLYMVKKIIDNAGGKIEVESKPGKGSVFHVYFKN